MSYKPNPLKAIFHATRRFLAKNWLSLMPATQIAITGSQGKTTTTYILYNVLRSMRNRKNKKRDVVVTDINLDTIYNVPITALKTRLKTDFIIFELGIDKKGEMEKHLQIVRPKIAIVTGISPVHSDKEHLGSLKNIILEKRKLVQASGKNSFSILSWDDENVRSMSKNTRSKIIWYGSNKNKCDVFYLKNTKWYEVSLEGTKFTFFDNKKRIDVETKFIGSHYIYNIMAVYSALKSINFILNKTLRLTKSDIEMFKKVISSIQPLHGRMSLEKGPRNTFVLNDSLRANPVSTRVGIKTLYDIVYTKGKKIIIMGEMGELGKLSISKHKEIGKVISKYPPDYFIGIGPLLKHTYSEAIKNGFSKEKGVVVKNVLEASNVLEKKLHENDLVYIKGSLLRHMERVLLKLEGVDVKCDAIVCPYYNSCIKCKYLKVGFKNAKKAN